MSELTSIVISGIVWDAIKKGVSITTGYLRKKLSSWVLDDEALEEVKEYVCNIPESYLISEGMIKEYINLNDRILSILETAKSSDVNVAQNMDYNTGLVIGNNSGTVNIKQYANGEQPRITQGESLFLVKNRSKFSPIQIVKSFSRTRDTCIIEDGTEDIVYADIVIPEEVRQKEECQFLMILFSYIPSENWLNYCNENYKMKFFIETSSNIKQMKLQIKNSCQYQFVNSEISEDEFSHSLSEIAPREAWKDVREICFTIFANDKYIVGEKGYIRIKGFRLEQ